MARPSSTRLAAGGARPVRKTTPAKTTPAKTPSSKAAKKPSAKPLPREPKSILLFSDGTGNSSGKLFKTNVWRLYEAVDLGLASAPKRVQIAYYDNGVGTSKIKLLALITGIFGIGLKRNILAIYRFVCRNWKEGDKIYCFGFSRGAFTIRMVAFLLATRGVVTFTTEADLNARTRDVLRDVRRENKPNLAAPIGKFNQALRDVAITVKRFLVGPRHKVQTDFGGVDIEFLGVWDTVAAYGGPSAEITRAIDNFIYPLTMTDQYLSPRVQVARHALSLDDERDSFQPILWDEWDWKKKARSASRKGQAKFKDFNERIQQVWFSGVHSDVGGGYPDESLSFVSLAWMMQEASNQGVRFLDNQWRRIRDMSNSLGPIHNSRGGLASYYRYQPRRMEAFFHKQASTKASYESTRIQRDPVRGERQYPPQGFLLSCKVHESVAARIADGTDRYAPITLPPAFDIVPFNFVGGGNPRVKPLAIARLRRRSKGWPQQRERIYDRVWWRRLAYFFTAIMTALLVLMPQYAGDAMFPATTDGQWVFQRLTSWTKVIPDLLQPWVRAFHTSPLLFVILVAAIIVGGATGKWLEREIRTHMHDLWQKRLDGKRFTSPSAGWVQRLRTDQSYQRAVQYLKWYVLPTLAGVAMLLGILYLFLVIVAQIGLSIADPDLCKRTTADPRELPSQGSSGFDASEPCNPTGMQVRKERPYALELAVPTTTDRRGQIVPNWSDGGHRASPAGIPASKLGNFGYLGAPFRRLVDARYLQVLRQVRPSNHGEREYASVLVTRLDFSTVDRSKANCWIYRADFVPGGPGELFLFANDAIAFGSPRYFYRNNRGQARVYLHELHALESKSRQSASDLPDPCALGPQPAKALRP